MDFKFIVVPLPANFVCYTVCAIDMEEVEKNKTDKELMHLCIKKGKDIALTLYEVIANERAKKQKDKT